MPLETPSVETPITFFKGGLDLVTPSLSLMAGHVIDAINFECAITGGYSRIKGYERVDGRTSPSTGTYTIVQINGYTNVPTVGQTLTGGTSAATGVIAYVASNYMVLTKVVGTFTTSENVAVGATPIGTATAITADPTAQENAIYLNAVADIYRADITTVGGASGSGAVLGAFMFNDVWYAFRANAGGTAVNLWKSTTGGWTQVTFKNEVSFVQSGAGAAVVDGATLTQGANSAIIRRVMLETGSWAGGNATGRFIVDTPAPGNFAAGAAVTGGAPVNLGGVQTAITMAVGGKFETVKANFGGQATTKRIYGVDGVNRAWEFDGTYLCPISTGTSPDTPKHIADHLNHLMLSFEGSLVHSDTGFPYQYAGATSGEITTEDTISGLVQLPGSQDSGALAIFQSESISILYGDGPPFNLVPYNIGVGSYHYTQQNFGDVFLFNENGISNLSTTLKFGNFNMASMTDQIMPLIRTLRTATSCTTLCRDKNQYRIFFTDGFGLYLTMSKGKPLGIMPVLFPHIAYCAWEGKKNDGTPVSCFGSTDGYLMQLEMGTSFDGQNINAALTFVWDANRSPRVMKDYLHYTLEVLSPTYAEVAFAYALGYGSDEYDPSFSTPLVVQGQLQAFWDSFTWDQFTWDGSRLNPSEVDMEGAAENVQVSLGSGTDYIDSYTINSAIFSLVNRRKLR